MLDRDALTRVIQGGMFSRALLLLLLVLNVGVAAWWLLRPADAPPAMVAAPAAPRLRLVGEPMPAAIRSAPLSAPATLRTPAAPASVATATSPVPPATMQREAVTAETTRCLRLGPFASDDALAHAQAAVQPLATRMRTATVPASTRGWRVWLPPLADRDAAQAMAARIAAAGFSDYYVMPNGAEANSIALGRYGNEDSALRRQAQLQAAGFAAQAQALGATTRWIDIAIPAATDDADLRANSGAAQSRALDCARLH